MARTVQTDEPIMKPLFLDNPDDQSTYTINDEWLLGDSLLVPPMLTDEPSRTVHVPAGHWFDVTRQRVITGPGRPDLLPGHSQPDTNIHPLGNPDTGTLMHALAAS